MIICYWRLMNSLCDQWNNVKQKDLATIDPEAKAA